MKTPSNLWLKLVFACLIATVGCTADKVSPEAGSEQRSATTVESAVVPAGTMVPIGPLVPGAPVIEHVTPGPVIAPGVAHTGAVRLDPPASYGTGYPSPATPTGYADVNGNQIASYAVPGDALVSDFATDQGGTTISNVQLELLFWGNAWSTENPSAGTIVSTVQKIMASTYLDAMGQYGYQSIALRGALQVDSDPPSSFTFDDVTNMVWNLIGQGTFPEPSDSGGRILYMVFMPKTVSYGGGTARGAHGDTWKIDTDDLSGVNWAWVGWVGAGNLAYTTDVFSHELVESISDPEPHAPAWLMDRTINNGQEIGDACNDTVDVLDGLTLQAYWSQAQGACVIPFPEPPTVTSVYPGTGDPAGGTSVTIGGTHFDALGSTRVFFGGTPATNVSCTSTACTATAPPGNGSVDVEVQVNHFKSAASAASGFSYVPSVTGVSPASGFSGDTVTIHGIGLQTGGTTVMFGTHASPSVNCNPGPDCVATVPAGAGTVDVIVTSGGFTSRPSPADRFAYAAPIVTSVSPTHGPVSGGTMIAIDGDGLDDDASATGSTQILFGGVASPSVSCFPGGWCQALSPPVSFAGPVDVQVSVYGIVSASSSADVFTYDPWPAITSLNVSFGGTGSLGLDGWAPPGGAVVSLASSDPSKVVVPATLTVPAGSLSASFSLVVDPSAQAESVTVTASYEGSSATAKLQLEPSPAITLSVPSSLATGASGTATITLNRPAPAGGALVALSATNATGVSFPASVIIPEGAYTATFTITSSYAGASKLVDVDATYEGQSASADVRVPSVVLTPPPVGCIGTRCF